MKSNPKPIPSEKKVVVIGGGTGTFTVLTGLAEYHNLDIAAVVTMADDGGSNKILRDEFGLLPTSGIRQCIVALAKNQGLLRQLFSYRYSQGTGIAGMTFGNLFMAAVTQIVGDARQAIKDTCRLLEVRGQVLPVSYEHTSLLAKYEDGSEVLGEHDIDVSNIKVGKKRIVSFRTVPVITLDKEARQAIESADLIVIGPGDLYTNTVANLVVKGMKSALVKSRAKIVFVMNLMTKKGESYGYKATDFLSDLVRYIPEERLDIIVINSDTSFTPRDLKKYRVEGSSPVEDDLGDTWNNARVIRTPLRATSKVTKQKGDKIARSLVRHDPVLLAKELLNLLD